MSSVKPRVLDFPGQQCLDPDHGHPDPGMGDSAAGGLVDLPAIPYLRLGQGALERDRPLRPREDLTNSVGSVEGHPNGELSGSVSMSSICEGAPLIRTL